MTKGSAQILQSLPGEMIPELRTDLDPIYPTGPSDECQKCFSTNVISNGKFARCKDCEYVWKVNPSDVDVTVCPICDEVVDSLVNHACGGKK
jgi:hypothetical protein